MKDVSITQRQPRTGDSFFKKDARVHIGSEDFDKLVSDMKSMLDQDIVKGPQSA